MTRLAGVVAAVALGCGSAGSPAPAHGADPGPEPTALCVALDDVDRDELESVELFGEQRLASDDDILAAPAIAALYDEDERSYSDAVITVAGQWLLASVERCRADNCPASIHLYDATGVRLRSAELPAGSNARGDAADIMLSLYDEDGDGRNSAWITYVVEGDSPAFHVAAFSVPELAARFHSIIGTVTFDPAEPACAPVGLSTVDANCDGARDLVLDKLCAIDECIQPEPPIECMFRDMVSDRSVFLWRTSSNRYEAAHESEQPTRAPLAADRTPTARAADACSAARRIDASDPACTLVDTARVGPASCDRWSQVYLDAAPDTTLANAAFDCLSTVADCAGIGLCMSQMVPAPRALTTEELASAELDTGVAACDVPYNKYLRCIAGSAPDQVVGIMLRGLVNAADAWNQAATTAEGRADLAVLCPAAAASWEESAKEMGCDW